MHLLRQYPTKSEVVDVILAFTVRELIVGSYQAMPSEPKGKEVKKLDLEESSTSPKSRRDGCLQ